MDDILDVIASRLNLPRIHVAAAARLLNEGATIPFISRYRKEATGGLDETQIRLIQTMIEALTRLNERRAAIIESIESQGKLTDDLRQRIERADTAAELEDIYLPYRPKRRTRATIARENGLEPLAKMIMARNGLSNPSAAAQRFINDKVATTDDAINGAKDIIAEWLTESPRARQSLRQRMRRHAIIRSSVAKGREADADKDFKNYVNFSHPLRAIASHQYLALRRGEALGVLNLDIEIDEQRAIDELTKHFTPQQSAQESAKIIAQAVSDGYKRLLRPQIETELSAEWKSTADQAAISLFSDNLRQLLLAAPLRGHKVIAIDPGYRTGCKVVALDQNGKLLDDDVIYPNPPQNDTVAATRTIMRLIDTYDIDTIALGDRTASRDTAAFLHESSIDDFVKVYVVSENGASVYSASDLARHEMPDKDVTVRGAVSIGRRLIDPLAELVKIDPKSIGVGQYQHDVDQAALRDALDFTVTSCVNLVGVDLNTASPRLLSYISGIGPAMAEKIVDYRTQHGAFASRDELKKVPRLGDKTYQQAAGFLRVPSSKNPLDNTGIHPESYNVVTRMAADLGVDLASLPANNDLINKINPANYAQAGTHTVADIIAELRKPGRDPRLDTANVDFDPTITSIDDLKAGIILPGKVNNITAFGAFIDIGIKENGLLHISQMSHRRPVNPGDIVKIGQILNVRVIDVDYDRHRISLSILDL